MWKYKFAILLILLSSYYISISTPFFGDEGLYSIAIKDNIELGLQPTATYFGETMYWKPALMFNVYAIIASPLYKIIPEEILFRTISFLFVILSLFVLFKFFKKEFNDEKKAYIALIIILITPAFFVFSIKVLTDTLMFFFICVALLTTQLIDNKWNKLFLGISLVGTGLTKSISFTLFTIMLISIYYFVKNKKINLEIIGIGMFSILIIMSYSVIFNLEQLNTQDINRLNMLNMDLTLEMLHLNISRIIGFLGIIFIALLKPKNNLLYFFTIVFLLYLLFNNHYVLPWYFYPILPILAIFFTEIKKPELLIILLFYNLILIFIVLSSTTYGNSNFNEIIKEDLTQTIYIGRLGEPVANKIYNYNSVMVTPENSFKFDLEKGKMKEWYGISEKMTKENLLGLIYDYENPEWYPKYVEDITIEEKYLPPIARTHKTFDGPFKQIIIEEKYYTKIETEINKNYEIKKIINTTSEQTIYILSLKK